MMPEVVKQWIADAETDVGLRVKAVKMNAVRYADLRKFGRDELDLVVRAELLKAGFQATFHGVEVWVSKQVGMDELGVRFEDESLHVYRRCLEAGTAACRHESCHTIREVLES